MLVQGLNGARYLNEVHGRYYLRHNPQHSCRPVYDVLCLDDPTKQLLYGGAGFKSFCSTVTRCKSEQENTSIYVPVESTPEIITQRYEKLLKEMQEQNWHVLRNLQRYHEQYQRYAERKRSRAQKQLLSHQQSFIIHKGAVTAHPASKPAPLPLNKNFYSYSQM